MGKIENLSLVIEKEIQKGKLGGASVYVEQHGKTLINKNYGSDRKDDIYRIFSMSKPIASVAAFILYERGELDLAVPVSTYLPDFDEMTYINERGKEEKATKKILVSDLLNMTSGIVYPEDCDSVGRIMKKNLEGLTVRRQNGEKVDKKEVRKVFAESPLAFEPGTSWKYGASADVLGILIEEISQMTLGEFYKKEIFEPLEMKDTAFYVTKENRNRIADFYKHTSDGNALELIDKKTADTLYLIDQADVPAFEAAGSGLYSTMEDYKHLLQMFLAKGIWNEKRILSENTIRFMSTNQLNEQQMKVIDFESIRGYGYGNLMRSMVSLVQAGSNGNIGEFGWDGLPGCYMMIDPKEDLIFLYMQQIGDGVDLSLRRRMRQVIYGAIEAH